MDMKHKMVPLVMTPQFPFSIILLKMLFCFGLGRTWISVC